MVKYHIVIILVQLFLDLYNTIRKIIFEAKSALSRAFAFVTIFFVCEKRFHEFLALFAVVCFWSPVKR